MNRKAVLNISVPVRIFRHAYGVMLSWDRMSAFAGGSTIEIAEPVERGYDHRVKIALPLTSDVQSQNDREVRGTFILYEELAPRDKEEVKKAFPGNPLLWVH